VLLSYVKFYKRADITLKQPKAGEAKASMGDNKIGNAAANNFLVLFIYPSWFSSYLKSVFTVTLAVSLSARLQYQ